MINFDFSNPTRIVFGKGEHKRIGELIKPMATKVLLHYGGGSIKKSGLYDDITASLRASGLSFAELGGVKPNPDVTLVREGIGLVKNEGVDFILAVGGGSAIDSAKAIAMGVYYDGDVWDIYEKSIMTEKTMPVATVLTIPAAGSESSNSSVISNEEKQMKRGCTNDITYPILSVVNPELFYTLPKNQIANGVADMISHIFERYFTDTQHVGLIDGCCETVLKTVMQNAVKVYDDPTDYNAWCQVGLGGTLAHNGWLGVGRGQDWACHAMEHELSALRDIPHGAGLAVLTPAWMKYVYRSNMDMFLKFAVNVMGGPGDNAQEQNKTIESAVGRLSEFYKRIGLPQTLTELGFIESEYELMAKRATRIAYGGEKPIGGFKKLNWNDVVEIFKIAG